MLALPSTRPHGLFSPTSAPRPNKLALPWCLAVSLQEWRFIERQWLCPCLSARLLWGWLPALCHSPNRYLFITRHATGCGPDWTLGWFSEAGVGVGPDHGHVLACLWICSTQVNGFNRPQSRYHPSKHPVHRARCRRGPVAPSRRSLPRGDFPDHSTFSPPHGYQDGAGFPVWMAYGGFRASTRYRRTQYNAHGHRVAYRPRIGGSPPPGSVFSGVFATHTVALATCRHLGLVVGAGIGYGEGGVHSAPLAAFAFSPPHLFAMGLDAAGLHASTVPSSVFP